MTAWPEPCAPAPAARPAGPRPGLREHNKARTRAAIREHASRLFRAQGYDATIKGADEPQPGVQVQPWGPQRLDEHLISLLAKYDTALPPGPTAG